MKRKTFWFRCLSMVLLLGVLVALVGCGEQAVNTANTAQSEPSIKSVEAAANPANPIESKKAIKEQENISGRVGEGNKPVAVKSVHASETVKIIPQEELKPYSMSDEEYEWFEKVAAKLEHDQKEIALYEREMKILTIEGYKNVPREEWTREDQNVYSMWSSQVFSLKTNYQKDALAYNEKRARCSCQLLEKTGKPLPREFKLYATTK